MNLGEAIRTFDDLLGRDFIPTQWRTFQLSDNTPGLPPLDPSRFIIMVIGQIIILITSTSEGGTERSTLQEGTGTLQEGTEKSPAGFPVYGVRS